MRKITSLVDHELTWTQPKIFKSEYELRFGSELVSKLYFPKFLRSKAQAEGADGCWMFERVGFWKPRIIVRTCSADTELAVYTHNTWRSSGILEMSDGRKFSVRTNLWKSTLEFCTEAGETLIHTKYRGVFRFTMTVQMYRKSLQIPELPWMVMLALFQVIIMRRDAAKHAAAG